MPRVRQALALIATIWLSSQLPMLMITPIAIWADGVDEHAAACTCTHGADATCPMHHKPAAGARVCVMQSASTQTAALMTSLFSFVGVMPHSTSVPALMQNSALPVKEPAAPIVAPVSPDPPPPRA